MSTLSSETQPLITPSKNVPTKTETTWCQNNKYLVSVIILLVLIVSIFFYDNIYNHYLNYTNSDLITSTTLETVILSKRLEKTWKWHQYAHDDDSIKLTFAIKQSNTDKLEETVKDISNPKSINYGKYLTVEEVHDLVKPSNDAINTVKSWLISQGIDEKDIENITPNFDFIRVKTTIKKANAMLNTQYGIWINENGEKHTRVKDNYHVPVHVAKHLDFVSPTLRFPLRKYITEKTYLSSVEDIKSMSTSAYVTPTLLTSLYDVPTITNYSEDNSQCIASFLEEFYDDDDLNEFWEVFDIEKTQTIRYPDLQPQGYGSEAELDVEYITAMGNDITTYVWYTDDDGYFITLVEQIIKTGILPWVVSMSYGGDEQSNGKEYCTRGNTEFAKASALGITFFASSGDTGSAGEIDCGDSGEYLPSFPASSPYVTAVGGTYGGHSRLPTEDITTYNSGEMGWFYSGGGFSAFFDRESYQDEAVNAYLNNNDITLPISTRYNSKGRAYPDISAQAVSYIICYESSFWSVSGTSCSCPSVAGMFALINNQRLINGKSTLGSLNSALYALYDSQSLYFNDVTSGYNEGCDTDDNIGFYAASGWDPVTGLGTPKLTQLLEYFVNL